MEVYGLLFMKDKLHKVGHNFVLRGAFDTLVTTHPIYLTIDAGMKFIY